MAKWKRKFGSREDPWWERGGNFICVPDCGRCCDDPGGIVYLSREDAERIAKHLKVSLKQWLSENNISPKYDIIESNSCVVTIKSTRKTIAKNTQKQINQSWNNLQKTKSVKLSNDKVLVMKSIST